MNYLEIENVIGREIIDSRGNPTVEAEVWLADGTIARGAAPSGASTGEFEGLELRDGDKSRFGGKGVSRAVNNVNTVIREAIVGMDASDIYAIDKAMIEADGTRTRASSALMLFWRSPSPAQEPQRPPSTFRCTASSAALTRTDFRFR